MRVLLDHCLDWRLRRDLPGHDVSAAGREGFEELRDGLLLAEAQKNFDVLLTCDQNMEYQQNLSRFDIAVVVVRNAKNRLFELRPLMPQVLALLPTLVPGQAVRVERP